MTLNDKFGPTFHEKGSQDEFILHLLKTSPDRDHISGEVLPMNGCSHSQKISVLYQADPSPAATCHPCVLHVDPCGKENLHPLSDHSFRTGIVW